ncbi:MAG: alpha/beta hydrolase [Solirubrobacterales bacterium]|nr:alpha/beta hydrolase [Solirubrobacterales bacterium]HRV58996.1 alpha/beta hydrolase [Solirubrobacterales bacterium]
MSEGFIHVFEPGDPSRTLLLLHGTGGDENDLVSLGRQLAPGAGILSPRGKVLENGMPRFFRRLEVGKLDIPDLLARTDELADWLGRAAGDYGFDPAGVIGLGISNGANIAASLLFRRPETLGGAALLRPMLPYPPPGDLDLDGAPVLVASGGQDHFVPAAESEELAQQLEAHGAEVEYVFDPASGHGITQDDLLAVRAWLATAFG